MMYGITRLVIPPPKLPQPPAVALAAPTIDLLKSCEHQTWQVTKLARPRPMMKRQMMKPLADWVKAMPMMPGTASMRMPKKARRAPNFSHSQPEMRRMPMVPATDAMFELPMSLLVRSRLSGFLMYAMSGAAAK
eukprot:6212017-Pleurochrysis_carterae.AAC.1